MHDFSFPVWHKNPLKKEDFDTLMLSGFKYAEISMDFPWPYWQADKFEGQIKSIKEAGMKIGVHLPWKDINLASPYDEVREGAMNYLLKLLEVLRKHEIEYAIAHISTREDVKIRDEWYYSKVADTLKRIASEYSNNNVEFVLENPPGGIFSKKESFVELVSSSQAKICLDVGHVISRSIKETGFNISIFKEKIIDWVDASAPLLHVLHLHGVAKVNNEVVEHYVMDGYEDIFAEAIRRASSDKRIVVTVEIFYKDLMRRPADTNIMIKAVRDLKSRLNI